MHVKTVVGLQASGFFKGRRGHLRSSLRLADSVLGVPKWGSHPHVVVSLIYELVSCCAHQSVDSQ